MRYKLEDLEVISVERPGLPRVLAASAGHVMFGAFRELVSRDYSLGHEQKLALLSALNVLDQAAHAGGYCVGETAFFV